MKTSQKQIEILQLITNGWEIGIDTGPSPTTWIQKGGLGRGGESKQVHFNTFDSLRYKGLIKRNHESFFANPQHYCITDKGRQVVAQVLP